MVSESNLGKRALRRPLGYSRSTIGFRIPPHANRASACARKRRIHAANTFGGNSRRTILRWADVSRRRQNALQIGMGVLARMGILRLLPAGIRSLFRRRPHRIRKSLAGARAVLQFLPCFRIRGNAYGGHRARTATRSALRTPPHRNRSSRHCRTRNAPSAHRRGKYRHDILRFRHRLPPNRHRQRNHVGILGRALHPHPPRGR